MIYEIGPRDAIITFDEEVSEAIHKWLTSVDCNQLRADSHLYQPLRYIADDAMAEEDAARCALLTVCGE